LTISGLFYGLLYLILASEGSMDTSYRLSGCMHSKNP
jgi:hypothetical protein